MCDNQAKSTLRNGVKVSYGWWNDGGLTPLERAAGVGDILYGKSNGYLDDEYVCECGECEECEERADGYFEGYWTCTCGTCDGCKILRDIQLKRQKKEIEKQNKKIEEQNNKIEEQKKELKNSARFKEAAKLVAGLSSNRETKLALIQKVRQDGLESAIVRYMAKEALPKYYAAILKSPNCIERLVEGLFYKVCKIQPANTLNEQIGNLSRELRGGV